MKLVSITNNGVTKGYNLDQLVLYRYTPSRLATEDDTYEGGWKKGEKVPSRLHLEFAVPIFFPGVDRVDGYTELYEVRLTGDEADDIFKILKANKI